MAMVVREFRPGDAGAVAEARRAALPFLVTTAEAVVWEAARAPAAQRSRMLVAEADGRVVGAVRAGLNHETAEPGHGLVSLAVHPARQGLGAGTALLEAAERHLARIGARRVAVWAPQDGRSVEFAERRGWRRVRQASFQRLDLTSPLPEPPALPPGVELRTAEDFAADPRPLYEADTECTADEPGDVPADAVRYEDWLTAYWEHPGLDRALTSVAVAEGRVAAFTAAQTDGRGRYWSGMTGTRRAYRGRGLARAVKLHSLVRARAAGCTEAFTGNDAANAPMLAVNARLGYRPSVVQWRCVRDLPPAGS
ncbi:GNAT family N-acetyltransferase [Streptomyces glaucosporus]